MTVYTILLFLLYLIDTTLSLDAFSCCSPLLAEIQLPYCNVLTLHTICYRIKQVFILVLRGFSSVGNFFVYFAEKTKGYDLKHLD